LQAINNLSNVEAIAAGENFSLALQNNGTIWSWGDDSTSQLGRDTSTATGTFSNLPAPVDTTLGLKSAVAIAADGGHALAIENQGKLWAWGDNSDRQLGIGKDKSGVTPTPVLYEKNQRLEELDHVKAIATGSNYSLALMADGSVLAWGGNERGQLGNRTQDPNTIHS